LETRCLVLGGKGFIGAHLVRTLVAAGCRVRVFDRPGLVSAALTDIGAAVEFMDGDFSDSVAVRRALIGCEVCFHLVSTTLPKSSNDDPSFDVQSNVVGTLALLDAARAEGLKKIIFLSSGGTVYGVPRYTPIDEQHPTDPTCSYGITKLAIEKYLELYRELYGLDYSILRLSNPFGEWQRTRASQGAVAVFLGKVWRGEPVQIWGDGSVVRDYVYIGDVVKAVIDAMRYQGDKRLFNIGSGVPTTLLDVLDAIETVTGRKADRSFLPARSFDVPVSVLSIDRAARELGWKPTTTFHAGLDRMANWLSRNPDY